MRNPFTGKALGIAAAALIGVAVAVAPTGQADPGGPSDQFIACMTENGVPAPPQGGHPGGPPGEAGTPTAPGGAGAPPPPPPGSRGPGGPGGGTPPPPPGVDQGVWNSALQACQSLAPAPPSQ